MKKLILCLMLLVDPLISMAQDENIKNGFFDSIAMLRC